MADGFDLNGPAAEVVLAVLGGQDGAARHQRAGSRRRVSASRPKAGRGAGRRASMRPVVPECGHCAPRATPSGIASWNREARRGSPSQGEGAKVTTPVFRSKN